MASIDYAIMFLFLLAALAIASLINFNEIDKRIDILEKYEQSRQLKQRRDKEYIEAKDLFNKW